MPERIQLRRVKGWRKPNGAVVVTRGTIFGNPWTCHATHRFHWPRAGSGWLSAHHLPGEPLTPAQAVEAYRAWLAGYAIAPHLRPENLTAKGNRAFWTDLARRRMAIWSRMDELRGRDLCCFCPHGQPCHADVLLVAANSRDPGTALMVMEIAQ